MNVVIIILPKGYLREKVPPTQDCKDPARRPKFKGLVLSTSEKLEKIADYIEIVYTTSGKKHFHEMNGDVGMAGWK